VELTELLLLQELVQPPVLEHSSDTVEPWVLLVLLLHVVMNHMLVCLVVLVPDMEPEELVAPEEESYPVVLLAHRLLLVTAVPDVPEVLENTEGLD
jgi:hypothetical protein